MAEKRDYYEVLGVTKESTPEEIKKTAAYFRERIGVDVNLDDASVARV